MWVRLDSARGLTPKVTPQTAFYDAGFPRKSAAPADSGFSLSPISAASDDSGLNVLVFENQDSAEMQVYTTSTYSSAISNRLASSQSMPEASESNITASFKIEPALPETLEPLLLDPISNKSQQHHHAPKHDIKNELQVGEASHSGGNIPLLVAMSPVSSLSGRPLAPTPTAAAAQQDHPFSGGSNIKPRFNFINLTAQPDQPTSSKAVQPGTAAAPRSYLSFRPSTSAPSPSSGEGYGMKRVYSDHAVDEFPLPPPSAPLSGSGRTGRRFSAVSIPASAMHQRSTTGSEASLMTKFVSTVDPSTSKLHRPANSTANSTASASHMSLPPNSVTQPQQATAPAKAMSPETVALMKKVANLDRDYGLSAASDGTHFSPAMLPVSKLVDMRKTESSANNMQRPATNAVASTMRPYSRSSTVPKHTESSSSTESGFLSRKSQSAAAAFVSNLGANLRRSSMTLTSATRLQGWDAEVQAGGDTGDVSVSSLKARAGSVARMVRVAPAPLPDQQGLVGSLAGQFTKFFNK